MLLTAAVERRRDSSSGSWVEPGHSGRLEDISAIGESFVLDNSCNMALRSLLPRPSARTKRGGDGIRHERLIPESPEVAQFLWTAGIAYSQGLAVSERGGFADELNPFA
jgi:hypothetical protein